MRNEHPPNSRFNRPTGRVRDTCLSNATPASLNSRTHSIVSHRLVWSGNGFFINARELQKRSDKSSIHMTYVRVMCTYIHSLWPMYVWCVPTSTKLGPRGAYQPLQQPAGNASFSRRFVDVPRVKHETGCDNWTQMRSSSVALSTSRAINLQGPARAHHPSTVVDNQPGRNREISDRPAIFRTTAGFSSLTASISMVRWTRTCPLTPIPTPGGLLTVTVKSAVFFRRRMSCDALQSGQAVSRPANRSTHTHTYTHTHTHTHDDSGVGAGPSVLSRLVSKRQCGGSSSRPRSEQAHRVRVFARSGPPEARNRMMHRVETFYIPCREAARRVALDKKECVALDKKECVALDKKECVTVDKKECVLRMHNSNGNSCAEKYAPDDRKRNVVHREQLSTPIATRTRR